jgi:hypothetical protein
MVLILSVSAEKVEPSFLKPRDLTVTGKASAPRRSW